MKLIARENHGSGLNDIYRSVVFSHFMKKIERVNAYRTDLLIEYEYCLRHMAKRKDFTRYVAFRENGVDHEAYFKNSDFADYSSVFRYSVRFTDDEYEVELMLLNKADYNTLFK